MVRARISSSRLEASVAINVPRLNNDIAQTKTGRVFILCSKKPVTGMTTDTVRRNAVVNHCTAPAVTLRSRMSRGMATAMSVSLRITTKVATRRRLMTSRLRPTVSTTTGPTTLSGDRLVVLSEFLIKYLPAMDHCDRSNRLLSPPLPDIARIRILRVTEKPEAKALKNLSRSVGFAQREGSNNYPGIGVSRYGNECGGGARRVAETFQFLQRKIRDLHAVFARRPDKCPTTDCATIVDCNVAHPRRNEAYPSIQICVRRIGHDYRLRHIRDPSNRAAICVAAY